MTNAVGNSSGQATAIGRPGMRGLAVGRSGPNVAISTLAAFSQFRKSGAQVRSAFYGALRVTKAYYGKALVARFAFTNTGVGSAAGAATAAAIGNSLATQGRGTANGVATASASSISNAPMVGSSTSVATVVGVPTGGGSGAGAASGVASVSGVGATTPMAFIFADTGGDPQGTMMQITQSTSSLNRRTWTMSLWAKLTSITPAEPTDTLTELCGIEINGSNGSDIIVVYDDGAWGTYERISGADKIDEYTNPSVITANSWTHYVVRMDTTQATAADRVRIYKNGTLQTTTASTTPAQNHDTNMFDNGLLLGIGGYPDNGSVFGAPADGSKIAFVDLVEGQSLAPTDFAFNNSGTWTRKKYTGSYGTHGWSIDGSKGVDTSAGKAYAFSTIGDALTMSSSDMPPFTN